MRRSVSARPLRRFACSALLSWSVASPAAPAESVDACLLERLHSAAADVTVGQIRARCADPDAAHKPVTEVESSPVRDREADESRLWTDRLAFLPHRPNYILPATWGEGFQGNDGTLDNNEFVFQFSLKLPITVPTDTGIPSFFFAYTGQSWWQAYNRKRSSPFREYNHSPELYFELRPDYALSHDWNLRTVQFGFEHTSNGRSGSRSRSWNRLFTNLELDQGLHWWSSLRLWSRIPERAKTSPDDAAGDDNPDIVRFYGNGELRFGYRGDELQWNLMGRRNLHSDGRGAWALNVSYPTGFNPKVRWYLRWFDGYGESLIDYNVRVRRIGFGLMLNDWY